MAFASKKNSAGSGTPLHYSGWKNFDSKDYFDKPILVTEGALNADVVSRFQPNFFAVANGGVSCAQELIVNISRVKTLYLAFDNDYYENPSVVRQLAKLLKLRFHDNRINLSESATKILSWTRAEKGIDDALLKGERLNEITILDWYSALNERCREEVRNVWEESVI